MRAKAGRRVVNAAWSRDTRLTWEDLKELLPEPK
jgi:hypothetical protein